MKNNNELLIAIESKLGRPLTAKERHQVISDGERVDRAQENIRQTKLQEQAMRAQRIKRNRNMVFRQALTAFISVAVCLAIIFPFMFSGGKDKMDPGYGGAFRNHVRLNMLEMHMRNVDNLLLFQEMIWLESFIEIYRNQPIVLSYIAYGVVLDEGETTLMDKRIRTNRNYQFLELYMNSFATLERANAKLGSGVRNPDKIYTFEVTRILHPTIRDADAETLTINAFVMDGITVFAHVGDDGSWAQLYFEFGGFEYFIDLEELEMQINIQFIKNVFMRTLLYQNTTKEENYE
ncbi:MAG: hypothetical protein FWE01_03465 [Firmicutes bacterium]|nr:hypothetical protein [Bacillota bacterium]